MENKDEFERSVFVFYNCIDSLFKNDPNFIKLGYSLMYTLVVTVAVSLIISLILLAVIHYQKQLQLGTNLGKFGTMGKYKNVYGTNIENINIII